MLPTYPEQHSRARGTAGAASRVPRAIHSRVVLPGCPEQHTHSRSRGTGELCFQETQTQHTPCTISPAFNPINAAANLSVRTSRARPAQHRATHKTLCTSIIHVYSVDELHTRINGACHSSNLQSMQPYLSVITSKAGPVQIRATHDKLYTDM